MLFVTITFTVFALGLLLLGWWGVRNSDRLSAVPGFDEKSRLRRRGLLRRGSYVCAGLGFAFLVSAVVSLFFLDVKVECPPNLRCPQKCVEGKPCLFTPVRPAGAVPHQ
jgi:hypothetical protein